MYFELLFANQEHVVSVSPDAAHDIDGDKNFYLIETSFLLFMPIGEVHQHAEHQYPTYAD